MDFMQSALTEARKGLGRTAPNPPVGAVVVKDGRIIGRGFHPKAGQPHAEIFALRDAGQAARGADIHVTLEPCSHYGKTPPCAEALIEAGVKTVHVGVLDPNPLVAGRGVKMLEDAGIGVVVHNDPDCAELIRWYSHWMQTGKPFVIAKAAQTLDGAIATMSGDSKWISCDESRQFVHELRNKVDGILVGIGTVKADDPLLTCRIENGRDPRRIIIDRDFEISAQAKVLDCLILTAKDPASRPEIKADVRQLELNENGRFDWDAILKLLGSEGMHSILVEGGSSLHSDLIASGQVDRLMLFVAPKILGGGRGIASWGEPEYISQSIRYRFVDCRRIGQDVLLELEP